MKILMLSGDFQPDTLDAGPVTYVRMTVPGRELARRGHSVLVTPQFSINAQTGEIAGIPVEGGDRITGFDVVVAKQTMRLHHPKVIERARAFGQQVWMDVDDWYFGLDTRNVAYDAIQKKNNPKTNVENLRKAFAAATGLICSTRYLAERMSRINRNTVVCRNAVDLGDWPDPVWPGDEMSIGWVASLRHRSGDLETLKGVLEPFMRDHNASLVHVGYHPKRDWFGIENILDLEGLDYAVWTAVRRSAYASEAFKPFNVGIVPLSYQPFNESKSYLKGLEYAMAGRPFVAAATGEYQYLQACGVGRVAKRPSHWLRHLKALTDPELRREEAKHHHKVASEEFAIERRVQEWSTAFEQSV